MVVYLGVRRGCPFPIVNYVLYDRYQCDNESQIRSCIKQCVLVSQKLKTRLNFLCELGPAYQLALEGLDLKFIIPNHEHARGHERCLRSLKVVKRNGGRVGKDKTVRTMKMRVACA